MNVEPGDLMAMECHEVVSTVLVSHRSFGRKGETWEGAQDAQGAQLDEQVKNITKQLEKWKALKALIKIANSSLGSNFLTQTDCR